MCHNSPLTERGKTDVTDPLETSLHALLGRFRRQRPLRSGSLLVTILGDAIAPRGGRVTLGSLIRLAEPFGLPERLVLTRHLLRNSCLPMVTLVGLSIPGLLAGNLLIEVLFNYPGLGLLFYNALGNEDYPVLLGYTVIGGVLTVIGNLIADVAVTVADPRIRLD